VTIVTNNSFSALFKSSNSVYVCRQQHSEKDDIYFVAVLCVCVCVCACVRVCLKIKIIIKDKLFFKDRK